MFYVGLFLFAYFFSDKLIFQPPSATYWNTAQIIKISSGNGEKVSAIYLPNPQARYTILYSHGNAEDLGIISPILNEINQMGFCVFAYDYRGYGTSEGKPSEEKAYEDVEAAYRYLVNTMKVNPKHIIALGRSLGGGIAVELACKRSLGGLIIESSYVSTFRVMTRASILPFDKFKSLAKLDQVPCPLLVIHGKRDEVIPFWHGETLFSAANEPKQCLWVANAHHNDLFAVAGEEYTKALWKFATLVKEQTTR